MFPYASSRTLFSHWDSKFLNPPRSFLPIHSVSQFLLREKDSILARTERKRQEYHLKQWVPRTRHSAVKGGTIIETEHQRRLERCIRFKEQNRRSEDSGRMCWTPRRMSWAGNEIETDPPGLGDVGGATEEAGFSRTVLTMTVRRAFFSSRGFWNSSFINAFAQSLAPGTTRLS